MPSKRILVFDDEIPALAGILYILQELGYEAVGGPDSEAIVKKYTDMKPDAAIIDVGVKRTVGCRIIKSILEKDPEANIIACGCRVAGEKDDALKAGAKVFISKPLLAEEMENALNQAFSS